MRSVNILILAAASMLFPSLLMAQQKPAWQLQWGLNGGRATGTYFGWALGGDLRLEKGICDRTSLLFTTGFTHFFEKDKIAFTQHSGYGSPYNVIPVKAGIKRYIGNWYLAGEAGAGLAFEQWGHAFAWSSAAGYACSNGIDISLRYEDFTNTGDTKQLVLRLAYGLRLSRQPAASKP
jgi:hypothetical protein